MYARTKAEDITHIVYATTGAENIVRVQQTRRQGTSGDAKPYRSRNTVVPRLGGLQEEEASGSSDGKSRKNRNSRSHAGRVWIA